MSKSQSLLPAAIDALARSSGAKKLDDPLTDGLSIERLASGKCRWLCRRRLPGLTITVTMRGGVFPATSIADARAWASDLNAKVEAGIDPRLAIREPELHGPMTVRRAHELYMVAVREGRSSSAKRPNKPRTIVDKENTYDSATGRLLLIPQGARLIGSYDSVVAFGQKRALIVWQRIILPDGSSLKLDNVPATDPSGYAGLEDKVDLHTWQLIKGVLLSTLLGVSPNLALSGQGDLVQAIRMSTQDNVSRAGDQITQRNLGIQPTIRIRPGAPVRLVVHKDLIFAPLKER